ncbi:fumarate hydratase [Alkalibacter rhizosphaerae]|uniref:Fumarate hydratase n=1 Tax=Alkalibacter rhizosphaerae TaxID=2815577 RepID=A0A974XFZ7_9FIRM|nr:fumarate hydratase [Alkalibacter rhizosphaerae]QSX07593.1 fumarate hydratase [Alkalibacter rhizosphaerae]
MKIHVDEIKEQVRKGFLRINCRLGPDVEQALEKAQTTEVSPIGIGVMGDILENMKLAAGSQSPICQDTGMAVVFLRIGQDVRLTGGGLNEAIHQGVREAYQEGYFRNSIVEDPLRRKNTGDNTPAVIHTELTEGNDVEMILTAKGFGSENMSGLRMLKPSAGRQGVIDFVVDVVRQAGPNACPPFFVGVGIGGTMEMSAILAKKALVRNAGEPNADPYYHQMEEELLERLNGLGIGPMGLGGANTVLSVQVETYPTHIAGLPVAVNMCCHVNRHEKIVIKGEEDRG